MSGTSDSAFVARLRAVTALGEDALGRLAAVWNERREVPRHRQFLKEGDRPDRLHLVLDGWAARVRLLPDGRRHLYPILPGEICDVDGLHTRHSDYAVVALTACRIASADRRAVLALDRAHPQLARLLSWLAVTDNLRFADLSMSLACHSARERLGRFLCEVRMRLEIAGKPQRDGVDLPVTQEVIGDTLGLTPVHVNRTFRLLRDDRLIHVVGRRLTVPDWAALARDCHFAAVPLRLDAE